MKTPITDTQVRAARELLRWSQQKLAEEADLSFTTIKRYELGQAVSEDVIAQIAAALEKAGVLLFGVTSINGVAVSGAIALRAWAKPEPRPPTRVYPNLNAKGRPKGSKNKGSTRVKRPSDHLSASETEPMDGSHPSVADAANKSER